MNTQSTGPARRSSRNKISWQSRRSLHDHTPDKLNSQPLPSDALLTASSASSRNSSPRRSEGSAPSHDGNHMVNRFLEELFGENSREQREFRTAPTVPHITRQSLAELDIANIINNSKLRHDVNFDRELHFRPNLDGERGREKQRAQYRYWLAVSAELHLVFHILKSAMDPKSKAQLIPECTHRLKGMFQTMRDIIKNLVPSRDQSDVDEHLDVRMLIQQVSRGTLNFVSIAEWTAQLLKRHCAPMRDEMVDRVVDKIRRQTPDSITAGLVDLFNVLEAMKLDVANHQIRHLRPLLIEDTINFEKKYHCSRIRKSKCDCKTARRWFVSVRDSAAFMQTYGDEVLPTRDVRAFVKGLLDLLLPSATPLPDTFSLDADRIRALQADIDEWIREWMCCDVLRDLVNERGSTLSQQDEDAFLSQLRIIAGDAPAWHVRDVDNIACEIVRFALQVTKSAEMFEAELGDAISDKLHLCLSALANARSTSTTLLDLEEERGKVPQYGSQIFEKLYPNVCRKVEELITSSPYDVFLELVPPSQPSPLVSTPLKLHQSDRQEDLERRIAHIAILHWRTWEHLVYCNEDLDRDVEDTRSEVASDNSASASGRSTSPSASPDE
ncbi:hypothetical protein, variant [Verruconis gallopava]|uniref:T-complex 11 n=1 Tax=Verruconis gallopava TaxID=253628 RepID=A0A0D2AEK2_9PEZI|nr:uncharacterized protein PV09_03928 [Verruconis gallopava]XP_016215287.1 hypothetical protein, variant [Verruconis gallopava]KIW05417.1 hypothetical protein PV09_03928 [Verruconis gallopava]KIW05418.1 hypothetical protein, variant [Verruconis gallopava]